MNEKGQGNALPMEREESAFPSFPQLKLNNMWQEIDPNHERTNIKLNEKIRIRSLSLKLSRMRSLTLFLKDAVFVDTLFQRMQSL